jgi:hypothetical protein
MRARAFALALTAVALACAVSEPPSGGPEDRDPPRVAATVPTSDSTGVDPSSPIAITFGEDMTRARVELLVSVQPPITVERIRWEGRTLIIEPRGGLQRDTTYVVTVKPGYRDRHGVTAIATREFAFATGAVLDTARIAGVVTFKREPAGKARVRCFRVPRDSTFRPEAARPDREAATARDGTFELRYLPADDARFVVMAFADINGNGTFESASEPFAVYGDTVVLVTQVPRVDGVRIDIIDPNEEGSVGGTVVNETGIDTVRTTVGLYTMRDSTHAQYLSVCDTSGAFAFPKVKPGTYRLWAFLDIRADSLRGTFECGEPSACDEPSVALADSIVVKPAARVVVERALVLRRKQ